MQRLSFITGAAAAALGISLSVGGVGVANGQPASVPVGNPAIVPMAQKYFWEWSDGHNSLGRTFRKSSYGGRQSRLPHLVVSAEPSSPRRTVTLKYYERGSWHTESTKRTNGSGRASLEFNPWCNAAHTKWCNGSWKYKVTIAGATKKFTIKFSSK